LHAYAHCVRDVVVVILGNSKGGHKYISRIYTARDSQNIDILLVVAESKNHDRPRGGDRGFDVASVAALLLLGVGPNAVCN
jgi:hypothetical protein